MTLTPSRHTQAARLAEFFKANPDRWIDGRDLASIAGLYGWRTRVSDLRHRPFRMAIDNRQRRAEGDDGSTFTVSEYRYRPSTSAPTPPPSATRQQGSPSSCNCDGSGWVSVVVEGVNRMARCACRQAGSRM